MEGEGGVEGEGEVAGGEVAGEGPEEGKGGLGEGGEGVIWVVEEEEEEYEEEPEWELGARHGRKEVQTEEERWKTAMDGGAWRGGAEWQVDFSSSLFFPKKLYGWGHMGLSSSFVSIDLNNCGFLIFLRVVFDKSQPLWKMMSD